MNEKLFKSGYDYCLGAILTDDVMKTAEETDEEYEDRMTKQAHFNNLVSRLGENKDAVSVVTKDGIKRGFALSGQYFFYCDKLPKEEYDRIMGEDLSKLDLLKITYGGKGADEIYIKYEKKMEQSITDKPYVFEKYSDFGEKFNLNEDDLLKAIRNEERLPFELISIKENYFSDILTNHYMDECDDLVDLDDIGLIPSDFGSDVSDYISENLIYDDESQSMVMPDIDFRASLFLKISSQMENRDRWENLYALYNKDGEEYIAPLPLVKNKDDLILSYKEFLNLCDTLEYIEYEVADLFSKEDDVSFLTDKQKADKEFTRKKNKELFSTLLEDTTAFDIQGEEIINPNFIDYREDDILYLKIDEDNIVEMFWSDNLVYEEDDIYGNVEINIYGKDGQEKDGGCLVVREKKPLRDCVDDALELCGYFNATYEFITEEEFTKLTNKNAPLGDGEQELERVRKKEPQKEEPKEKINCITMQDIDGFEMKKRQHKGEER